MAAVLFEYQQNFREDVFQFVKLVFVFENEKT